MHAFYRHHPGITRYFSLTYLDLHNGQLAWLDTDVRIGISIGEKREPTIEISAPIRLC
jgi:hypothetical protein